MEKITEETHRELCDSWYEKAREVKLSELSDFIGSIINGYDHDYGTIVHAIAACGMAAMWAANKEPGACGGITGFQASCVDLQILKHMRGLDGPFRIVDFSKMLFPQYKQNFKNVLPKETWNWLQKEAFEKLRIQQDSHPNVIAHWESIVDGKVPFGWKVEKDI